MKMKVHRFKQTTGSGSSQELDREQYSKVKLVVPTNSLPFINVQCVYQVGLASTKLYERSYSNDSLAS